MASDWISELTRLIDKIALELVFAQPGKDQGLLPINSLLGEMTEHCHHGGVPPAIVEGLRVAQRWIDNVFERDGLFSESVLKDFARFTSWLQSSLSAAALQKDVESFADTQTEAEATVSHAESAAPSEILRDEPIMLHLDSDAELLREFVTESQEHLQAIELGILALEDDPTNRDTLNSIFRAFHTLKGGSGFLNLKPMNRLAHELESLLDLARQGKLVISGDVATLILRGGDTLKHFVDAITEQLGGEVPITPITFPTIELLRHVQAVIENPDAIAAAASPTATETEADSPAASTKSTASTRSASTGAAVKVSTSKLDSMLDLVGELVIAQSLVTQRVIGSQADPQLARNMAQLARITKELQRTSLSLRMVPIRPTFQKMARLVRDLCGKANKDVELTFSGEETEVDRTLVEEVADPLVHMVRNAVDHGIEPSEARRAKGKPARGTIHLSAFHQAGNIVIEVRDDGAGLNKDRILAKAIDRGIVHPGTTLTDKQIYDLIFEAGFSTAEVVTDLSGRGVGMDVVIRNVHRLRGRVEIDSKQGAGSMFRIHLPLTLAIIDGLIAGLGEQRFVFPTLAVRESFRPRAEMLSTIQERGEVLNIRGQIVPLLRLWEYFGLEPKAREVTEGIVIVTEANGHTRAVLVDELLGKQEVVIKSLGESFQNNRALAGATILADGKLGLILDPSALVKLKSEPLHEAA